MYCFDITTTTAHVVLVPPLGCAALAPHLSRAAVPPLAAPRCCALSSPIAKAAAPSEQASQARSHQARARELPPQRAHVLGVQLRNVRLGAVHLLQHARVD